MIDPGLRGKVALVTGCNRRGGIGAAIARALAAQGAAVGLVVVPMAAVREGTATMSVVEPSAELVDRPDGSRVGNASMDGSALLAELRAAGATAELFEADLSDPGACFDLFDRVAETLGPVTVLVNNAAYSKPDTLLPAERGIFARVTLPLTAAGLDAHHALNVRAPALLTAELCRRYVERGATWGRVVNISTDGAAVFPSEVSYGATKNALESLSRSAAHELGPARITVNIVAPGPIQTGWITDEMLPGIHRDTPLGRVGRPDDVADVVVFLASEQARWVTGQTVYVGGGHRMV